MIFDLHRSPLDGLCFLCRPIACGFFLRWSFPALIPDPLRVHLRPSFQDGAVLLALFIGRLADDDILKLTLHGLLDELGTISPGSGLSMVEQSYGLMAGLGIRIWAFLQDLPQLQRDYPQSWETFLSNSSVIQLLNVAENTTSTYFSQYLGNKTVNSRTGSWSYKQVRWQMGQYGKLREEHEKTMRELVRRGRTPQQLAQVLPGHLASVEEESMTNHMVSWQERMEKEGKTPYYYMNWVPDEQLASRPVSAAGSDCSAAWSKTAPAAESIPVRLLGPTVTVFSS